MSAWILPTLAMACACAPVHAATPDHARFVVVDQAGWHSARALATELRRSVPPGPRLETVRVDFTGPRGIRFEGRGAVAVLPGQALRMILLGPAGRTALDVWATPDRYRLSIPDLKIVERGGRSAPAHLPVELFRAWFLAPLGDRLMAAGAQNGERVLLFGGGASGPLEVRFGEQRGEATAMALTKGHSDERVEWWSTKGRFLPGVGDTVRFRRPSLELEVAIQIEDVSSEPPNAEAFAPPEDA